MTAKTMPASQWPVCAQKNQSGAEPLSTVKAHWPKRVLLVGIGTKPESMPDLLQGAANVDWVADWGQG